MVIGNDDITEPESVEPLFVTGVNVLLDKQTAAICGFADLPVIGERRILVRMVMSRDTAQTLYLDLWKALRKPVNSS